MNCFELKRWKFWKCKEVAEEEDLNDSWRFFFDFNTLDAATDHFSEENQLGSGGFGPVFKGRMPNGQEIAVKRLALGSRQGVREFSNEVKLLLKIQHRNLVNLLGCCYEGAEKMLVYEYLPNKSLDNFLFDNRKAAILNWPKRFEIIMGVAKGLVYLHEESQVRIIHRDIKASNVLLDDQLNPKISDFGLARLFPGDDTHVNTFHISGTHGYMAPEYARLGQLSVKSDVFSFGVLVLEIVSGRKNHDQKLGNGGDLLSYTWRLYQEGKAWEVVDPNLDKWNRDEMGACIQIALLCCQANARERPDMFSVVLMLSSDSFTLPKPGKPGIQGRIGNWNTASSSAPTTTNSNTNTKTDTNTTSTVINTKASSSSITLEEISRNSVSISFTTEGR